MSGFAFPDQSYVRQCMMCGFAAGRNEWDETPAVTHCPNCGIELERMACRECRAPLTFQRDSWAVMFGGSTRPAKFCAYCGEPTAPPHEAQRRTKPLETKNDPAVDLWLRTIATRIIRGDGQ